MQFRLSFSALFLAIVALLSGCAGLEYDTRISKTSFKPEAYAKVRSWAVRTAYENGGGANRSDIVLREDLYYALRENSSLRIDQNGDGGILISVDQASRGNCYSIVTVRLVDASGEVLCRMKVQDMTADGLTARKFTQYLAEHIIKEISGQGDRR
jgi:hypothetical protein